MFGYTDFILERYLDLILESNMAYSREFKRILRKMNNPIATFILSKYSHNVDISINYLFTTDQDDTVGFTDPKKVKEDKCEVMDASKVYPSFDVLFNYFAIPKSSYIDRFVNDGDEGVVVAEINSDKIKELYPNWNQTDVTLCHFKRDDGRETVMNKIGLAIATPKSKTQIKIGRFVRKFLEITDYKFNDSDIETFVNQYKAVYAIVKNEFSNIKVVKGDEIKKWYNFENYETQYGTLGGSCMKGEECQKYFDIYTQNDNVSLVILLSDNDSTKICGRALLWKLDNLDIPFLDRVYTNDDSDVNVFLHYAKDKGYLRKKTQISSALGAFVYPDDTEVRNPSLSVTIKPGEYNHYPYLDTLKYYKIETGRLSNIEDNYDYNLEDTGGTNNQCPVCNNTRNMECEECEGSGHLECSLCDGSGTEECDTCDGSGMMFCPKCEDGTYACDVCNGTGEYDGEKCYNCNGDGRIKCEKCDSTSMVKCTDCDGIGKSDCFRCDGEGKIECRECDGSGHVPCSEC
jgi:hypothetical protein